MLQRGLKAWFGLLLAALALVFWWLTQPKPVDPASLVYSSPDPVNGELMFHAGSCAACHEDDLRGGHELITPFGIFRVPNISPDEQTGIGNWSDIDFINASSIHQLLFG